jgi:uncharacterized protein
MKKLFFIVGFLLITALYAMPKFPTLDSYVVDKVGLLDLNNKDQLIRKLKEYEKNSSNQIVVVILKSLDNQDIETYGYQLGRYWKIGQKDKDNGVLLIISMAEHKIRIEVGYGLESTISDAVAFDIIHTILTPKFRQKKYFEAINEATDAIIKAAANDYKISDESKLLKQDEDFIPYLFISFILMQVFVSKTTKDKKIRKIFSNITISFILTIFSWVMFHNISISIIAFLGIFFFLYYKNLKKENAIYSESIDINRSNSSNVNSSSNNSSANSNNGIKGGGGSFGGGGASGSW